MKIKFTLTILFLFSLLLVSCVTLEVGIESTPTSEPKVTSTSATPTVGLTPQAGENQAPVTETPGGEPTSTPGAKPQPSSPYAGLVYRLGDGLFQVGPDGQPVALAAGIDPQVLPDQFTPRAVVSADGKRMISWWDWSDLWLVDLASGETSNLTNTTDREECCAQFWPGRPDVIVFLTRPMNSDGLSYQMAAIQMDGSGYRILDENAAPLGLPALSPDGSTLAYDPAGRPWLYRWDGGPEAINPADYGLLTPLENYGLSNPSWSPSGKYLAWMASGNPMGSGNPQGGVIVFDLQVKSYRFLHPYQPAGSEGGFLAPVWSPDGNWLAVFDHSLSQPGVWVMHLDGSGERLAYSPGTARSVLGLQVLWSPDSQRLLVADPNAEGGIRLTVLNLSSGQIEVSPLAPEAILLGWVQ